MSEANKEQLSISIEDRIEEAFWELVRDNSPERISVVALSKQAHCNRGTFYYYYTDIYDLLDRLIEKNLPTGVPLQVLAYMGGKVNVEVVRQALAQEQEKIKRLGFLLMKSDSGYCSEKLKDATIDMWCTSLGVDAQDMGKSDRLLFEFVANGVLGMMAYAGKHYEEYEVEDLVDALVPEMPQALLARVARQREEGLISRRSA